MASKYDREREKLGVRSTPSPQTKSNSSQTSSKYSAERERITSGAPEPSAPKREIMRDTLASPIFSRPAATIMDMSPKSSPEPKSSPLATSIEGIAAKRDSLSPRPALPTFQDILDKPGGGETRTIPEKWLDERLAKDRDQAAKNPVTKAINTALEPLSRGIYGATASIPGVASFQRGAAESLGVESFAPPESGPKWAGVTGGVIGNIAGSAAGMQGAGIRPVDDFLQLGRGVAQGAAQRVPGLANPIANRTIEGLTGGLAAGMADSAIRGQTDIKDLAIGGGLGAVTGGLLDGGGALLGQAGRSARNAAQDIVGNQLTAANAIETAARSVPTERLRVQNNTERLSNLMEQIRPVVTERMTPPLENQREIARWLQPHLGGTSLNEINRLPYNDMVDLANEVRRSMTVPDMARQVAKERGQDLDGLLNQTAPTFRQTAERMRMGGVAGAIEPPKNVRVAIKPGEPLETAQGEAIRQGWFSKMFGDQQMGISALGRGKSNRMVSTEQQIVNNPIINSVTGGVEKAKQTARAAYQNNVDYLSPLKNINRETYNTAMDASRANNIANTIVRDKFVDNQGTVIGNSLNDIMKNTRGLGKKVDDYLVLRHAVTRMERGERVYDAALGMTPQKARQAIQTMEQRYPELTRVGQEWDEWNTNILDNAVSEGLISQAARDAMRQQNPNYASMRRQFSTAEKFAQPKWGSGGSAFSGQKAPIHEVSPTGSTRKIVSPLRSAIEQAYAWKNAELRNRTMQEIVKSIQADPQGMKSIAELVKKPSTSMQSLDDALRQGGSEEFLDLLENDFRSLFQPAKAGDEKVVRAMVNGNPVYVKIHDTEAAKALMGMGSDQAGIVLKSMQYLSDATKRGATGLLSPMFAIKSVTGDTVQAAIQSPNAFKHIAVDLPHAAISSIGDMLRIPGIKNLAEDFRRAGGEYSALLRGDRRLNTSVSQLRREAPLSTRGIAKGAVAAVKAPFKALEKVSDVSENLNRMAAFRRAMVGKERTPENVRNAINAARESTVNFSRRGAMSQQAESLVPYQNAAIQGMYRLTKAFYKNPVKTLAGLTTLVIAPKMYEYARFNDDPDYQRLPARERYRHIITSKNADGTFNKQFMPPEYMAFGAFLQDVLNDVIHNDPEAYKGTLDSLVNAFTPPIVSGALQGPTQGEGWEGSIAGVANASVLGPAASIGFNQSFTGAPIVPQRLENRSPELQYDERTSAVGKFIGEKLGLSPMKADYLMRSYGGDPARLLLPLTSDFGGGNTKNTLLRNFIVDPVFTNTLSDDYYSAKEELARARADNAAGRDFPEWYSEEIYKLANSTAKNAPAKRISDLNAEKRSIQGDTTMSAEEKTQKLRDIQGEINEIYLDVNSKLREAGVPMPNR